MTRYSRRGVYYFDGRVRCPLAGVGTRGAFASNRLALEDDHSEVEIDRTARRITVRNSHRYARRAVIADLTFLADGETRSGRRVPLALHLEVKKRGDKLSLDLHRHLRTQEPLAGADFEGFEVVVDDGQRRRVVLDPASAMDLVSRPSLALLLVKSLMAMRDHAREADLSPSAPGFRLADFSMGFGALGLRWMLVRAQLEPLSPLAALGDGSLAAMLTAGSWEMRLVALSRRWLPMVVKRDLFLFGLEEVPLLSRVRREGLREGEALSFRLEAGRGSIHVGGESAPLPQALDVARAYIEFHMLGGLLAQKAEDLAATVSRAPTGTPAPPAELARSS